MLGTMTTDTEGSTTSVDLGEKVLNHSYSVSNCHLRLRFMHPHQRLRHVLTSNHNSASF